MRLAAQLSGNLTKGVLKADFLPGPQPTDAGYQPPDTGLHFRNDLAMIFQFPEEILCAVFAFIKGTAIPSKFR